MRKIWMIGLLLVGCATPYQPKGMMGGFSEKQLQDGVYKVEFKGNNYTDRQMARDFALLRCAEVALDNGYRYFAVQDTEANFRTKSGDAPTKVPGTIISVGRTGPVAEEKEPKPFSRTFVRHTIHCFKDRPAGKDKPVYDAQETREKIRQSYNLK